MEECTGLTSFEADRFQDKAAVVASAVAAGVVVAADRVSVVVGVEQDDSLWLAVVCSSVLGVIHHCFRPPRPSW
jgi:hypothetical protein